MDLDSGLAAAMAGGRTIAVLGAGYLLLFLLERALPLRRSKARLLPRLLVNVAVSAVAFATAGMLVQPAAAAALGFTQDESFGLLRLAGLTGAPEVVAAFLLLDLSFYYWHVANHRIAFLWRFHNVHHVDPDLDVSTAFRFHFVEVGLSAGLRILQVILIGPSLFAYAVYEAAFNSARSSITVIRGCRSSSSPPSTHCSSRRECTAFTIPTFARKTARTSAWCSHGGIGFTARCV